MLSVSGRESLVDTAVRTSKSGYMQRRLINAMDDLKVFNDDMLSVRNTANRIIQFSYGEELIQAVVSMERRSTSMSSSMAPWEPKAVRESLEKALSVKNAKKTLAHGTMLKNSTMEVASDGR